MKKKMETERENPDVVKIYAKVYWHSEDGKFGIVKAIYPEGFIRALTTKKLAASKEPHKVKEIAARHATTESAYALVPLRYVLSNANEFGEVAP